MMNDIIGCVDRYAPIVWYWFCKIFGLIGMMSIFKAIKDNADNGTRSSLRDDDNVGRRLFWGVYLKSV
jgi:hypothetical protein